MKEFRYAPDDPPVLKNLSISLKAGTIHRVSGPSGCGKTTLLALLSGSLPVPGSRQILDAELGGFPVEKACRSAQNPFLGLATPNVIDELLLGPEFREECAEAVFRKALETIRSLRLEPLIGKPTAALSFGEARLISLAGLWQYPVPALLLDEPFSGLDEIRRRQAEAVLQEIAQRGCAVVITDTCSRQPEHETRLEVMPIEAPPDPPLIRFSPAVKPLSLKNAAWMDHHGPAGTSVQVNPGRALLLTGPNGSGKTRLLMHVAGMIPLSSGHCDFDGVRAFVAANPDQQISAPDLQTEWLTGAVNSSEEAEALGDYLGLDAPRGRSPLLLSFGQKKRVALISAFMRRPACLLFDEPLAGLDEARRRRLIR